MRKNERKNNELRTISLHKDAVVHAEGSTLIEYGQTRVLCTASIEDNIPKWLQGQGRGWVSAEYGMLPRSTHTRMRREKAASSGRTMEISRLIARSLRACVNLEKLGERQITVDCDVIQADGGTRTAAITGGFVALGLAIEKLLQAELLTENPLLSYISAVSVGLTEDGQVLLDLDYEEDSAIGTDMNIVMLGDGQFVELQGTAETQAFSRDQLNEMLAVAEQGCRELMQRQAEFLTFLKPEL